MPLARVLNDAGISRFESYISDLKADPSLSPPDEILADAETSEPLEIAIELELREFASRLEAAQYLDSKLSESGLKDVERYRELWAWISLFYFDSICPADEVGVRKPGELARYVPQPQNYLRYYRHLLAGPYRIFRAHRDSPERALALLGGSLSTPGELVEQFASRLEIVTNPAVVETTTRLYWDTARKKAKKGAGGKGPGSARRLADVLLQFDVTWDLPAMSADNLLQLLPSEFGKFRGSKSARST